MDKVDILLELIKEIKANLIAHSNVLSDIREDLNIHIKRTDLAEQRIEINTDNMNKSQEKLELEATELRKRIEKLEEPTKLKNLAFKYLVTLTKISGAIIAIGAFKNYIIQFLHSL
jgi:ABC-type phosphate transport system auxiliary subunit